MRLLLLRNGRDSNLEAPRGQAPRHPPEHQHVDENRLRDTGAIRGTGIDLGTGSNGTRSGCQDASARIKSQINHLSASTGEWVTYLSSGKIAERKPYYTNFLTSR